MNSQDSQERYHRYLKSNSWQEKRQAVLEAAGYRCSRCDSRATEVHHETYERVYNELLSDLTALCSECHRIEHSKFGKGPRVCYGCETIQTDKRKYLIDWINNDFTPVCHACYFERTGLDFREDS